MVVGLLPLAKDFIISNSSEFLVSIQSINSSDFDILYLCQSTAIDYQKKLERLKSTEIKIVNRNYNGIEISDITHLKNSSKFSVAFVRGVVCLSESAVLVENCIRISKDESRETFKSQNSRLSAFTMVKEDNGNLFIRNQQIANLFTFPDWVEKLNLLYQENALSLLDLKHGDGQYLLNGFSIANDVAQGLSALQQQQSVPFQLARFIPNSSRVFFHFGISDFIKWNTDVQLNLKAEFLSQLGDEVVFYNTREDKPGIIFEQNEKIELPQLQKKINSFTQSYEYFLGSDIRTINSKAEIRILLSKFIAIDSSLFCVLKDNSLIISYNVDELKFTLESIERDDTWGKSLVFQDFFENSLQESNFSMVVKDLTLRLKKSPQLAKLLASNNFSTMEWLSVQHTALDDHFYTNINIREQKKHKTIIPAKAKEVQFQSTIQSLHTFSNLKPSTLLVETTNHELYSLDNTGKMAWSLTVSDRLVGSVDLVDFFKNGRQQYFIPTSSQLYLIDRLGKNISTYPLTLPHKNEFSGVVDYDKSKNYRFLTAGNRALYLYDKQQNSLEGWNPKKFNEDFLFVPKHYRIGGKDYFFVILKDGTVHLFNRRGDYVSNFPVDLKIKPSGDYNLSIGSTLKDSHLIVVSKEGAVHKLSLGIQGVDKIELVRSKDCSFHLVESDDGSSFDVIRIDPISITAFNTVGEQLFSITNPGSDNLRAQIFKLPSGKLYCFYDDNQKLTYIFDESGTGHPISPIESSLPITIQFNPESKSSFLYAGREKTLSIIPISNY